jgi:hypothetical protein
MTAARRLYAGLHLLDRQLLDRDAGPAGKVDDVELTRDETRNQLVVTALYSGSGALWRRLGAERLGAWCGRMVAATRGSGVAPDTATAGPGVIAGRIPFERVVEIGPAIRLAAGADELATHAGERWVRRHVVAHIPGSGHAPE